MASPDFTTITATQIAPPPAWAVTQRQLISTMEAAASIVEEKEEDAAGNPYFVHDVDDVYESRAMRALFYAAGAGHRLLDMALREWNATTRFYSEEVKPAPGEPIHEMYMAQLHNEWWNLAIPFNSDWFHMGEGSESFFEFGLADPTIAENIRRSRKFAAMFIGEDPDAPNYDPEHKIIRSPFTSSVGPLLKARGAPPLIHSNGEVTGDLELVKSWLDPGSMGDFGHRRGSRQGPSKGPLFTHMYPIVKDLESDWYEDPKRREEILSIFDDVVLNGDEPSNLCATGLVTNAYLYTGDEKYKKWVLDYVDVWIDRTKQNNGVVPDNVGPTGKIGEHREGLWWNGIHGWNRRGGCDRMFIALTVAAECALLLSGDFGYLDLLRSQLRLMLDNAMPRDDGHLLVPNRYGPDGWAEPRQMPLREPAHLYHASMSKEDYDLIVTLREGDKDGDWNRVASAGDGKGGVADQSRFQYYDGKNPEWPLKMMQADLDHVLRIIDTLRLDTRDVATKLRDDFWPPNPIAMKGLTHLTMGSPQPMYNGGLQRGQVRIFDRDRRRPGLPLDVAALVDKLEAERTGVQLVNLSPTETRRVIVQAGVFGEHRFTEVRFNEESYAREGQPSMWARSERVQTQRTVSVDSNDLAVELPPSTSIQIDAGTRRFVNDPSYAFPWH